MKIRYPYVFLKKVTSTNDVAKKMDVKDDFFVLFAREQLKGRGRFRDRYWYSPESSGIYITVIINKLKNIEFDALRYITLISALSVVYTLKDIYGIKCSIKEPNDIYVSGRKICGVLAESKSKGDNILGIYAGMGINIFKPDIIPEDITDKAIYLNELCDIKDDYEENAERIINCISDTFVDFFTMLENKKYSRIDEIFNSFLI